MELDLRPSLNWPEPKLEIEPRGDDGPVLVTVEYAIAPRDGPAFSETMREVGRLRRRDGAIQWGVYHDAAEPSRYVETFLVESWLEHLRQHQRGTLADRTIEARVRAFHIGDAPPRVSHLIHARPDADTA